MAHLTVRRPSPTTVSFTVSNAPTKNTLAAIVLSYVALTLRIAVSCLAISAVVAKVVSEQPSTWCLEWVDYIPLPLRTAVQATPWLLLLPGAAVLLFISFRRFHTEESLLVLRTLGIQTSTSSRTYLSTPTTRFIPTSRIQDIFIHEAFKGFEVRYYLTVVVKDDREATVVFPTLLPRLHIVEQVWRGARHCLLEPSNGKPLA